LGVAILLEENFQAQHEDQAKTARSTASYRKLYQNAAVPALLALSSFANRLWHSSLSYGWLPGNKPALL
jgi:hypothetical protein